MLRRVVAVLSLGLAVALGAPARANDPTQPPPPPGAHRLIRLGPQALVVEDHAGNVSMVDEPSPGISKGQAIGSAFGAVGGGVAGIILREGRDVAVGAIYGAGEPLEDSETPASLTEQRRLTTPTMTPTPTPKKSPP